MNKSLLDTDILSEIGKGIDPNVARNAAAYRGAFGQYRFDRRRPTGYVLDIPKLPLAIPVAGTTMNYIPRAAIDAP